MKDNRKVGIFFIVALFIVGVLVVMVIGRKEPTVQEAAVMPPTEVSAGEKIQADDTAVPVVSTEKTEPEPTIAELASEAAAPALKTGLESTNPDAVNLTNGDIQLIEMFAFW